MKKTIALALMLALAGGFAHAEENKADAKKPEKAKKKEQKQPSQKSDKNVFQKAESDIGHWARKNKVWGTPRPGD
jgi:hypothetical protein